MGAERAAGPADFNRAVVEEFRTNAGKVGGMFEGAALVLLTTVGARTGRRHTTPLVFMDDGGRLLVFASNAGGRADPAWLHNARADPRVTVETGDGDGVATYAALALPLEGEERDRLYALQSELVPAYAEYQRQTDRVIPVVALYRAVADAGRAGAVGDHVVKVHADLRRELADVRERAEAFLEGRAAAENAPDLLRQLRTHCLTLCDALGEHHVNEDRVFPRIEGRHPGLTPVLDRLRREHVAVAGLKEELRRVLDGLGDGDPGRVRAELARITAEIEAHFAYEEEQIVPLLNAMDPAVLAGRTG